MNSFINIQVRILAQQAQQQLNQMSSQLNQLEKSTGRASSGASMFGRSLAGIGLDSFGSKVQWAGRQLEYNFTLPIVAAGGAAMKMALDNETAMTRITKVYGDATRGADFYAKEITALKNNFEALSNAYGVNQTEVLNVGAAWAAAGASGLALAKSVDLTMQTMILGEMGATEATQALISIQAQYGFGVAELTKTIATLNMVENQTGISLAGLVQGFERSAGVARSTGVDVRHLAAMLASLVPATGSAAQAGNALKTIFSRLISPTKETVEVLGLMGIKTDEMAWKSATMTDRLIVMAKKFKDLSSSQKGVVSSVAASRWQVNKFEVLMRDLLNTNGYYQRALEATADETHVFTQMNKELQAVLNSNPRRLQIIWTMLQNAMTDIIQPMIPLILWLAEAVQRAVSAFSELPQPVQLSILGLVVFLAAIGPIIRIFGALALMTAEVGKAFLLLAAPIAWVSKSLWALVKIPVMAFLGAMGVIARGGVVAFYFLTVGIQKAMAGIQIALLTGAAVAGNVWRAGWGVLATITAGTLATMGVLVRRGVMYVQLAVLAGAKAVGIAWRAMLMGLAAIQAAWSAVMAISWSRLFVTLAAITTAGFSGIAALFTRFIGVLRAFSGAAVAALTGPWGIAITAVIVLLVAFWDDLKNLWSAVVTGTINAFNALPSGIQGALRAVVNIVQQAAMAVYRLFSYLNPWAHHSPSLVENVTTGMAEVGRQFQKAKGFASAFRSAYQDMKIFGKALAVLQAQSDAKEFGEMRKAIKAIDPAALASFDRLNAILPRLKSYLADLKTQLDAQSARVDSWKEKLDLANAALDRQTAKLDKLKKVVDGYQAALSKAQEKLDSYANAPIKGMQAMSDAIFENEMQQKRLRLELMKMEKAVGPMDQLQKKIDAINGQIEMLKGQQTDLRNAGAGSEILSVYDDQIDALKRQQTAINNQLAPMQNLSNQIDELGRKAEMLDLEQSLRFDPLTRQIEQATNAMKELPFDQIMAGIKSSQAEVKRLTEAYNEAQAAVDKQQSIVDQYTAQRDAVQARYDAENKALEKLKKEYDFYEQQIRDVESALRDASQAAESLNRAKGSMSPGAQNFIDAAGGNFPDPGGFAEIGREGGIGDQSKMIDDFTKEMAQKTKDMFGVFNFLDPVKKAWNSTINWMRANIFPAFSEFGSSVKGALSDVDMPDFGTFGATLKDIGNWLLNTGKLIWELIGPQVVDLAKSAWDGLKGAFQSIKPEIQKFKELAGPLGELFKNIWTILKPLLGVILAIAGALLSGIIKGLAGALGPVLQGVGDLIAGIIRVIRGLIEFVTGVFTGDWKLAWEGVVNIFGGIWDAVWGVLKGLVTGVWGLISGFVTGIIDFFVHLYDVLVGHSIIPDMVKEIIAWIASLPGKAYNALTAFVTRMGDRAKEAMARLRLYAAAGWKVFTDWLGGLGAAAYAKISGFVTRMGDRGREAINKLREMASTAWSSVTSWLGGRASAAGSAIAGVVTTLGQKGKDAMIRFRDGIVEKWDNAKSWLSGMAGAIKRAIGNISLLDIGKSIISSLLDGMKRAWNTVTGWLDGRGDDIQQHKGPMRKDKVLLVKQGQAIIDSLGIGMQDKWPGVTNWLDQLAQQIQQKLMVNGAWDPQFAYANNPNNIAAQNRTATSSNSEASGSSTVNFYGDLSFPNVKNGNDAEEFLANLEAITRGR